MSVATRQVSVYPIEDIPSIEDKGRLNRYLSDEIWRSSLPHTARGQLMELLARGMKWK